MILEPILSTFMLCGAVLFGTRLTEGRLFPSMGGGGSRKSARPLSPDSELPSKSPLDKREFATQFSCGVCQKAYSSLSEALDCSHVERWADSGVRLSSTITPETSQKRPKSPPITGGTSLKTLPAKLSSVNTDLTTTTISREPDETSMTPQDLLGWKKRKMRAKRRGG